MHCFAGTIKYFNQIQNNSLFENGRHFERKGAKVLLTTSSGISVADEGPLLETMLLSATYTGHVLKNILKGVYLMF